MLDKNISLSALKTLATVSETESFSLASERLYISPSAVSHQMKLLEQQLGFPLFERRAHGVKLTSAGQRLADYAVKAMQLINTGLSRAGEQTQRQSLTIAVTPSFGHYWLQPRLSQFHDLYPQLELQLIAQDRLVDFNQQQIDIHIHFGDGQAIGLKSEYLISEAAVPVCHPSLLEVYPSPIELLCASSSRLLHYKAGDEDAPGGITWSDWFSRHNLQPEPNQQHSYFSHLHMALNAANLKQGIALAWQSLLNTEATASLVLLSDITTPLKFNHYLVAPEHHWQREPVQKFCQWLRSILD